MVDLQFFVCKRKAKIKLIFFKKSFFKFFLKKNSFGLSVMTLSTHKKTDDILCVCVYIYIYICIYIWDRCRPSDQWRGTFCCIRVCRISVCGPCKETSTWCRKRKKSCWGTAVSGRVESSTYQPECVCRKEQF